VSKPDTLQQMQVEFEACLILAKNRNKKWGDAWREYSVEALVSHSRAKLQRALNCMKQGYIGDVQDIIDSLRDSINYSNFALIKCTEQLEGP